MATAERFFSEDDKAAITAAIVAAEKKTSGEIRVHIESKCPGSVLDRAAACFDNLKMHETAERNGVLFYLAVESRVFAIFGDKGINEKVEADFWNSISAAMEADFKAGDFVKGLSGGIAATGEKLAAHFPVRKENPNELSDEISFE